MPFYKLDENILWKSEMPKKCKNVYLKLLRACNNVRSGNFDVD